MTVKIDRVERDIDGQVNKVVAVVGLTEIGFVVTEKEKITETYRMNIFGGKTFISPADWQTLIRQIYGIFYEKKPKKEALKTKV